jgi:hypothetical protein
MTYDHITDQFAPDLSPLARRMYAAMYDFAMTSTPTYLAEWHIADELGNREMCISQEFSAAMKELTDNFLVKELHDLGCRYELTSRAWRAHLLHERSLREQAFQALESTERALERCVDEADEQAPSALGNCANCGIELNNVTTGMVVVHRENRHITVCGPCADSLVARKLYTIVAQARSLTAESDAAALLRDAVEGRR